MAVKTIVTAPELAARYHVTPPTVHAWHRRGRIPCLRAGHRPVLFHVEDVDAALRRRAEQREGNR